MKLFLDDVSRIFFVDGMDEETENVRLSIRDGSPLPEIVWRPGQPQGGTSENCLAIVQGRTGLSDAGCFYLFNAFCENLRFDVNKK